MEEHRNSALEKDKELERIKQKRLKELLKELEDKRSVNAKIVHVTDSNFDEIVNKGQLVLIDFWAEWCMPCRMIAPIIEELAKEYAEKVLVGKLNVDENPDTANRFNVFSIPTLIIMQNGVEVDRIVGLVPRSQIESYIKKHLK